MSLALLLLLASVLQFGILVASALTPRALNWTGQLAPLPPMLRQMFWVYGAFIAFTILSFGTITLLHAETLAGGSPLARTFCTVVAVFWAARLAVQFFVFDPKPYLTNWFYTVGYHSLTVVFILLVTIYGWAALAPNS